MNWRRGLAIASMVFLCSSPAARAGQLTPGLERQIAGKSGSEEIKVLVVLRDQAAIRTMDADLRAVRAPMAQRHREGGDELRAVADRSQGSLRSELQMRAASRSGGIRGFTSYWLVNAMTVVGTVDAVRELALRADVDVIEADLQVELIEPVAGSTVEEDLRGGGIGIPPGIVAVGARRVWNELGIDGTGALVANMDTGVDGNHPALSARWRGNFAPVAECWRDVVGTPSSFPVDNNGHGTHVMGTITGRAPNDSIGVAPGALWIANNTIDQGVGSAFDNDVLDALQWFSDPDGNSLTTDDVPDVVQNSWRINENFGGNYVDCDSRWWAAIDNCEAAGVVLTWSAGNEGPGSTTIGSPADRATTAFNAFSVGSTFPNPPYNISGFSSRGPSGCGGAFAVKPEIVAPGDGIYSSWPGGGYQLLSGTSMAGPHIAGVVALMRSANPDIDAQTVKQIIMDPAIDLGAGGEDNTYGHGFVDAYEAVLASLTGYGTIEGVVTDAISGDPIANVAVDVLADPREATTDVDGFFRIMLPAGAWNLEFTQFGYEVGSLPINVVAQQIADGDFAMTLSPQAIVSGFVRDFTNAVVAGATVSALGTPLAAATTLPDGSYTLSVPDGNTFEIRARKNGYGSHTESVVVSGGTVQDFVLPELTAEDFESGNFAIWPWTFSGNSAWTIDPTMAFEGENSARSGVITHNQTTTMETTLPVAAAGNVSFWLNVSSESGLDLLRFYIDGVLKGTWSGPTPWTQASYAVANGTHTFRWTYSKNSSGSVGADAAWVDFIDFPNIGFPEVVLGSESVVESLVQDGTSTQQFGISNVGVGQLDFTASVHGVPAALPGRDEVLAPGEEDLLLGNGGPDAFGYRWIDSDEAGGPTYQWVEIGGLGSGILLGDNGFTAPIPIGFTFPFYGNNCLSFQISSNGFISFSAAPGAYNLNTTLPNVADPDDVVAAFWDDLNPLEGGSIRTYHDVANQRRIIQWTNVPLAGTGGAAKQTFQIILNADGTILTQYKTVNSPTSATVGIENATGSDGLQVVFNGAYLHNNLAIRFGTAPPVTWLTVAPPAGSIAPGGNAVLDLDFDATGLALGQYEALLRITTNDPDETQLNVPVTLNVTNATGAEVVIGLPTEFEMAVPRPNPFGSATSIRYAVPVEGGRVAITIYDVSGRQVRSLVNGAAAAGRHVANWDGRDDAGRRVTSGVYFAKMEAGSFTQVQKVTALK